MKLEEGEELEVRVGVYLEGCLEGGDEKSLVKTITMQALSRTPTIRQTSSTPRPLNNTHDPIVEYG